MATQLTADSSVVIPMLLRWHSLHQQAVAALADVKWLPAHALAESFSVVTRLPPPQSTLPDQAWQALLRSFPEQPVVLSAAGYISALSRLAEARMAGGRAYDAIVAATAMQAGARLLTADRRAVATYALVGAEYELVE